MSSAIAESLLGCASIPEPETSLEGIGIVAEPRLPGQASQFLGVTSAEHDVVRLQRRHEMLHDVGDFLAPLLLAVTFQARRSQIVLEGVALAVGQMAKLHRLRNPVDD